MFPLSRYHEYTSVPSARTWGSRQTPKTTQVTDQDNASLAYFLSDPACKSLFITL
jgi:hypothetical protein